MKKKIQFIGFLCLSVMFSSVNAQENERSLLKDIEKVKKEIKSEKDLLTQELERDKIYRAQAKSRKSETLVQLNTLKAQKDSIRRQVTDLENSNKNLAGSSRFFDGQRAKFAQTLSMLLDSMSAEISKGFPFEASMHSENLKNTASGLRSGSVSPEEGVIRAWSVISTRLRKSLETELFSGTIRHENAEVSGTYLRYGLALSFFKSEDHQVMKYYDPQSKSYKDIAEDLEMRRKFREIFEVMEGKAPPSLVQIPLWIELSSKSEIPAPSSELKKGAE